MISEAELRRMRPRERRELARLLAAIDQTGQAGPGRMIPRRGPRLRRLIGTLVLCGCCVVLAAWIVVLSLTLHRHFRATHWRGAWVGFDIAMLGAFAATAWAYWRERQVVIMCLIFTATQLCCDAWFDIVLDLGTRGVWISLASAVFVELPIAALFFLAASRLIRQSARMMMELEGIGGPAPPLWRIPLFGEGITATLPRRLHARARRDDGPGE